MELTTAAQTGQNVRAEMARAGVSQSEMAASIGISQSSLSKRLRGVVALDVNELNSIAQALDLPVSTLLPRSKEVTS